MPGHLLEEELTCRECEAAFSDQRQSLAADPSDTLVTAEYDVVIIGEGQ